MELEFTAKTKEKIDRYRSRYAEARAALLPVLYLAQEEFGVIDRPVLELVSGTLALPVAEVTEVATFYTMFNKKPVGKHHIQVCQNLPCSLMGAETIISYLEKKLGIRCGETTADGRFTLTRVECLGACGGAPMMQINDDYYENLTPARVDEILEGLS